MHPDQDPHSGIRQYYDDVYYRSASGHGGTSRHLRGLARRIGVRGGERVLDVGCGLGEWLLAARECGAVPAGIDLSSKAIAVCRERMPEGEFAAGPAETLPFPDQSFDVVTCLGSLEHFLQPESALREMVRVGRPHARYVLLVPNADFMTRRLGLYRGTEQRAVREEARTLKAWGDLFRVAGLEVRARWADLHVLSRDWIMRSGIWRAPLRAAQALALAAWPLSWQYQVYHLCAAGSDDRHLGNDAERPVPGADFR